MSKHNNNLLHPNVQKALKEYGIEFGVLPCESKYADTAEFCDHYGYKPDQAANTIIVSDKSKERFAACVILATSKLDVNKKVCALMNVKRASFARIDDATRLSGMEYGGISAAGLPPSVPVYIDEAVFQQHEIILGGGNRTSKFYLNPKELMKIPGIQVIKALAYPR